MLYTHMYVQMFVPAHAEAKGGGFWMLCCAILHLFFLRQGLSLNLVPASLSEPPASSPPPDPEVTSVHTSQAVGR